MACKLDEVKVLEGEDGYGRPIRMEIPWEAFNRLVQRYEDAFGNLDTPDGAYRLATQWVDQKHFPNLDYVYMLGNAILKEMRS
jgi:hypothetical protein